MQTEFSMNHCWSNELPVKWHRTGTSYKIERTNCTVSIPNTFRGEKKKKKKTGVCCMERMGAAQLSVQNSKKRPIERTLESTYRTFLSVVNWQSPPDRSRFCYSSWFISHFLTVHRRCYPLLFATARKWEIKSRRTHPRSMTLALVPLSSLPSRIRIPSVVTH